MISETQYRKVFNQCSATALLSVLPKMFANDSGVSVPADLIGAQILGFGEVKKRKGDDASCQLGIDYTPHGKEETKRLVLGFDDQSMWIESLSNLPLS